MSKRRNKSSQGLFSKSYAIFALSMALIAFTIILLNTYSSLQSKQVMDEALKNSSELSKSLYDIQERFCDSAEVMVRYLPEIAGTDDTAGVKKLAPAQMDRDYLKWLATLVQAVSTDFAMQRRLCQGYLYNINSPANTAGMQVYHDIRTDSKSHISMIFGYKSASELKALETELKQTGRPVWTTVNQPMYNKYYLICIVPLYVNDVYLGYIGLVLNSGAFKEIYPELRSDKWRYSFLLTEMNEILAHDSYPGGERIEYVNSKLYAPLALSIAESESGSVMFEENGRTWIYAFDKMPTGQVYVEAQQRLHRVMGTNFLVFQTALMAIFATALVQKWRNEDRDTFFGWITSRVLYARRDAHPLAANSNRAVLSLHIGCIGGMLSHLLFLLLSGGQAIQIAFYSTVLAVLLLALKIYQSQGRTTKKLVVIAFLTLLLPVVMQVLSLEPGVSDLIWILIAVVGALFVTGVNDARYVFYTFVITLFLYTLVEIFIFGNALPQILMPIIGSLFFIGFALFSSVGVYVSSSENAYNKLEETLEQLKNAESLIVQREKMVTLGRLVAGVAHEINTPMGAIKASVETLDASLERVFRLLMENSGGFDEHDRDDFFKLVSMLVQSIGEMNTTTQARKARPLIRAFVSEILPEDGDFIADRIIRLEICNIELLKANAEVLKKPKARAMLKLLCDVTPIVSGSQTIRYAVSRASKIIFALRSYSHYSAPGEMELFDIAQSVDNVLTLYHNQIKQNIILERDFDDLPKILGSADELSQVWTNLVHNALQAMPDGGTMTIKLRDALDGYLEAVFADTGEGIPPDVRDKIFEPFFTTKPLGEGSGLGLDISKKIIERHKGVIKVHSEPGHGSTFTVRLPLNGDCVGDSAGVTEDMV